MQTDYDKQAQEFLDKFGIQFKATLSDTKDPDWKRGEDHGHHYRITLKRGGAGQYTTAQWNKLCESEKKRALGRLSFDFWGSIADREAGIKTEKAYSVLACISSDVFCPDTFKEFCSEYGYEEDSISALQTFRRCSSFSRRIRAFFTEAEIEALQEIQ